MKKNKIRSELLSLIPAVFLGLIVAACFLSCPENDEGEDRSVSSITIYNIPEFIIVDNPTRKTDHPYYRPDVVDKKSKPFSIYLNVSNSMDHTDKQGNLLLPEAKGYAQFKNAEFDENTKTYTITVNFMDPNPGFGMPPYNWRDKPWKGTAKYFSVSITPYDISEYGLDEVWVKGGLTLDSGKASYDWSNPRDLIDFRQRGTIDYSYQADELYKLIVSADRNMKSNTRPYHYGYPHGGTTGVTCPAHQNNGCNKYSSLGKPCTHDTTHTDYYCYSHFPDYEKFSYDDYYADGIYIGGYVLN